MGHCPQLGWTCSLSVTNTLFIRRLTHSCVYMPDFLAVCRTLPLRAETRFFACSYPQVMGFQCSPHGPFPHCVLFWGHRACTSYVLCACLAGGAYCCSPQTLFGAPLQEVRMFLWHHGVERGVSTMSPPHLCCSRVSHTQLHSHTTSRHAPVHFF